MAAARVRETKTELEEGDRIVPRGFRGPSATSRRLRACQHSIAIEYTIILFWDLKPASLSKSPTLSLSLLVTPIVALAKLLTHTCN